MFGWNAATKDPDVKILSLTITSPDRPDLVLPIPFTNDPKKSLFILKEGSKCAMKFTFSVSNNIVSGLKYTNVIWKTGVRGLRQYSWCLTYFLWVELNNV